MHSHKHKCTLTMVGKLICTGYASPSLMFSISFLPREVLANWMETTSPNTVDLLQAGRHPSAKLHEAACTCACMYTNIHAHVQAFSLHSLKVVTGEKEPRPGARTHSLRPNTEFQLCKPPVWPQLSNSKLPYIYSHGWIAILRPLKTCA